MQNEEYCIPVFMFHIFVQSQVTRHRMIAGRVVDRNTVERGLLELDKFCYSSFGTFRELKQTKQLSIVLH